MPGAELPPNRLSAGGGLVSRNEAKLMAQPVCSGPWQSGIDLKSPPTTLPVGTCNRAPPRMTETILDWIGLPSISFFTSAIKTPDPCEWPIKTTPRPWLSCSR